LSATHPTKVTLSDIPVKRRRGGASLRTLLGPATVGSTTGYMGTVTLNRGEYLPEHYHPYSDEFLFVVRGALTVRIDGKPVEVGAGEGVLIRRNERHRLQYAGDEETFAVFHLCPLAPRPELGHVGTEPSPAAAPSPSPRPGVPRDQTQSTVTRHS